MPGDFYELAAGSALVHTCLCMEPALFKTRVLVAKTSRPFGHFLRVCTVVQPSTKDHRSMNRTLKERNPNQNVLAWQSERKRAEWSSDTNEVDIQQKIPLATIPSKRCLITAAVDISRCPSPQRRFTDLLTEGTAMLYDRVPRVWENVQNECFDGEQLRVCSYNVLCQRQIARNGFLYQHVLSSFDREYQLSWQYRSTLLAREFEMMDADILCLQEVQYDHFKQFYEPTLARVGYTGVYKRRTGPMIDGCAIFYKPNVHLESYQPLEYNFAEGSHLNRDNIGQIARFRVKSTGAEICVLNTHLVFNKRLGNVKLAQAAVLLANIDKECSSSKGRKCPFIVCGDFNMEPHSSMYHLFTDGCLSFDNLRQFEVSGQGEVGGVRLDSDILPSSSNIGTDCRFHESSDECCCDPVEWTHNLKMASAYSHMTRNSAPEVSTFQSENAHNPDFIFYSVNQRDVQRLDEDENQDTVLLTEGRLHLVRRLTLPDETVLRSTLGPWPNSATPSDHIPLIADFVLE